MVPKPRICRGNGDKAYGKTCCVCHKIINAGEEIVSYVNNPRYRHATCVPKITVVSQTDEEERRRILADGKELADIIDQNTKQSQKRNAKRRRR